MKKLKNFIYVLLFASSYSLACSPIPGLDLIEKESKLSFLGTVKNIENGKVTFIIEQEITSVNNKEIVLDLEKKGTCSFNFKVGQKWLYSGQNINDKTVLLEDKNKKIREIIISKELPYQNKDWNSCTSSSQCKIVGYACSITTVNEKNLNNLEKLINKTGLSPANVNCFAPVKYPYLNQSVCIKNECSFLDIKDVQKNNLE